MKNPISLDGLVSWLEQQDPETGYDYFNQQDCLLCRYFKAVGLPVRSVHSKGWYDATGTDHPLPYKMDMVSAHSYTYGEALSYGEVLPFARCVLAAERTGA